MPAQMVLPESEVRTMRVVGNSGVKGAVKAATGFGPNRPGWPFNRQL